MALDHVRVKLYYGRKDTSHRSIPGFSTRRVVKDTWHSNPFNWLVLKDTKVWQTPVSQLLHCRLQRRIRLQGWTVEADLVKLRVAWFGFGFGLGCGHRVNRATEAEMGTDEVRTWRFSRFLPEQSRFIYFVTDQKQGRLPWNLFGGLESKVLLLDVSISPSLKWDVLCFEWKWN